MPVNPNAYCDITDLRKGDIPLPGYMGDGSKYVDGAAEEIDAAIGHIYVTPVVLDPDAKPTDRPASLMLKKINWLLASGRLVLDLAAASENQNQHAYGMGMLKEGLALLAKVQSGEIVLTGAAPIPVDSATQEGVFTGPAVFNEDEQSLVQSFYDRHNPNIPAASLLPPQPYGLMRP